MRERPQQMLDAVLSGERQADVARRFLVTRQAVSDVVRRAGFRSRVGSGRIFCECTEEGCDTVSDRQGLCSKHLWRLKQWGHTSLRRGRKLTADQAREILQLIEEGMRQTDIAEQFGIGQSAVSAMKRGLYWKFV